MIAHASFYGWKLLGVFWLILFAASAFPLYGGGVMNAYMAADLAVERRLLGMPMSIYQLVFGLGAPLVALSVQRFGVRRTLAAGAMVLAAGALAMATLVQNGFAGALVFGLAVGAGAALAGGIATQVGVARWFLQRRALAFAILLSAPGVGGFFVATLVNAVIIAAGGNWRVGWWLVAGASVLAACLALLFVREQPSDLGQLPDGATRPAQGDGRDGAGASLGAVKPFLTRETWSTRDVWRDRTFWWMLVAALGVYAGYTLFFAVGVIHLEELGRSKTLGAWSLSLFGISALLGKAALAAFGDRIDPRYVWAATIGGFAIGLWLLAAPPDEWALYVFPVFLGFGFGGGLACMMAVLSNYYGARVFPTVAGLAVAITTSIGALSPIVVGALATTVEGYTPAFRTLAVACAAGALLMVVLQRPVRRTETSAAATGTAH